MLKAYNLLLIIIVLFATLILINLLTISSFAGAIVLVLGTASVVMCMYMVGVIYSDIKKESK